ncbi:hypothetical protein [Bradyrhizobium sp.]|nr:hypothetical protein [Bradyrhizobium sp.]MBV8916539.1 hypothetical protein [Bradyrhizobium sp.]
MSNEAAAAWLITAGNTANATPKRLIPSSQNAANAGSSFFTPIKSASG